MMQPRKPIAHLFLFSVSASLILNPLPSQSRTAYNAPVISKQVDTEALIIESFMAKKNVVEHFFSAAPTLAEIQDDSRTASGISVYVRRIPGVVSSFDIERTESLVNPYTGYVTIDYQQELCGLTPERMDDSSSSDFVTEEEAFSVLEQCPYWQEENAGRNFDRKLVFLFEYSGSNWRLTNIDRYFNGRKADTSPVFDLAFYPNLPPIRGRRRVTHEGLIQHHSKWNDLVTSLLD